ncbi:hypothetical protein ASE88_01435 [Sphingomonas sp. Leaf38]|nr:hypothetical protein ASE88_01435 [Sphingomonas sp. Leaf38]
MVAFPSVRRTGTGRSQSGMATCPEAGVAAMAIDSHSGPMRTNIIMASMRSADARMMRRSVMPL